MTQNALELCTSSHSLTQKRNRRELKLVGLVQHHRELPAVVAQRFQQTPQVGLDPLGVLERPVHNVEQVVAFLGLAPDLLAEHSRPRPGGTHLEVAFPDRAVVGTAREVPEAVADFAQSHVEARVAEGRLDAVGVSGGQLVVLLDRVQQGLGLEAAWAVGGSQRYRFAGVVESEEEEFDLLGLDGSEEETLGERNHL